MVVSANAAALGAMGSAETEVLGKQLSSIFEKPAPARLQSYLSRALRGSAVRCAARLKSAPAASVQLRIRLQVSGPNCSVEASWVVHERREGPPRPEDGDPGARRAAFEALFQAYLELQEINKQKTAMVAAATHELKTPLAVISGACELLLGGGLGPLDPQQREIVALSHQNCKRLLNVVNSFLDYSAVEQGKLALRLAEVDVADLLTDTASYWKRLAQTRGVTFESRVAKSLPNVHADRAKLQNVLNGLCDNALKFTPAGGQITLSADLHFWERRLAMVPVNSERRERENEKLNAVCFSLNDTGPGIAAEFHQEIFEEYFQVSGGPSGGMGLGLSIARKIIAAHKGKIWVESRLGHGTRFSFVIPQ